MSKAPWYKRFASDFVSDPYVRAMTYEQQGWYNAMLDLSWIHTPQGYLPNDKQMLSKCLGLLEQTSRQNFLDNCGDVLSRFKISEDGAFLYHPKMLEQAEHMTQVSEKRRDAGKSGGRKQVNQLQSKCLASAKQLPIDSDTDIDTKKNRAFALPEWVPLEAWKAYEEMRKKKRCPMTDRARELAIKELDKLRSQGHSPEAVLNQSVFNTWQGLFAPKNVPATNATSPRPESLLDRMARKESERGKSCPA